MKDENVTYAYMYRRISSWNQVGNNSLDAQKEAIMQYAEEHNIKIVGDYVDSAKSGTTTKNRTAWLKMLSDMDKNPQVTEVLTNYLNRTARNARDLLNTSYDLALKGKRIITTDGLDTLNPEHREKILDAAAEAEKYSLLLKRETMKGLKVNAEKMLHNGGTRQIVKSSATKNTIRRKEVETKARTRVDDINDFIKLLIGKSSEIKALWKEETQTVIDVFIRASLPRRMRISEINSCIKSLFKLLKQRKFRAIIQCYGFRVDSFKRP